MLVQKKEWNLLDFENQISNQIFTYISKKSNSVNKKENTIDELFNE